MLVQLLLQLDDARVGRAGALEDELRGREGDLGQVESRRRRRHIAVHQLACLK